MKGNPTRKFSAQGAPLASGKLPSQSGLTASGKLPSQSGPHATDKFFAAGDHLTAGGPLTSDSPPAPDAPPATDALLARVRSRLAARDDIDDEAAERIIAREVFGDPTFSHLSAECLGALCKKIFYKTRSNLGVLKPFVEDGSVSEIMVNGPEKIFVERNGRISRAEERFDSVEELEDVMQSIASGVHREINELNPIVDARLPDGSRVNGVYKNVAVGGPILTVRKFSQSYMRLADLTANGTVSPEGAVLLETLVACGYNIFVSGGTSSGKTTLLNALSEFIPRGERVIVIEDSAELQLSFIENLVRLECRQANLQGRGQITASQLIKSSLRMRPDRIIVGEVRGGEVLDMLQAMNTGHAGSMSTGHGNSAAGMLKRLEAMYLMAMPLDIQAIRAQIAEGIDVMVHVERTNEGRRITEISELVEATEKGFVLNRIMEADAKGLAFTGNRLQNMGKLRRKEKRFADRLQELGVID